MTTHVLSVDPGDPSGWALWREASPRRFRLALFGELSDPDGPGVSTLLGALLADCRDCELVIEAQWYRDPEPVVRGISRAKGRARKGRTWRSPKGTILEVDLGAKRGGAPWDAVAKVVASRARWEAVCGLSGMRLHPPVAPGVWIVAMTKGFPARETHQRVRGVTMRRWGERFDRLGYDEAAAVLLGEWWLREHARVVDREGAPRRGLRGIPEREEEA